MRQNCTNKWIVVCFRGIGFQALQIGRSAHASLYKAMQGRLFPAETVFYLLVALDSDGSEHFFIKRFDCKLRIGPAF
jgi:hypothetical protein